MGTEKCIDCPAGSSSDYGATYCLVCSSIPNSMHFSNMECRCNAGYTGMLVMPGNYQTYQGIPVGGTCTACAAGTYKYTPGYADCNSCIYGTGPVASNSGHNCICNSGYYGNYVPNSGGCLFSCPANTLLLPHPKGTKGQADCSSDLYYTLNYPGCPLTGSFVTQCRSCAAQDGYFWDTLNGVCMQCTNTKYRTARVSNMFSSEWEPLLGLYTNALTCISCPERYESGSWAAGRANSCGCSSGLCQSNCNTGSNTYSYCSDTTTNNCPPGRGLVSGTCTNCVAGTYKNTVGTNQCRSCGNTAELATGPMFSQSRDNCVCEAGYGWKGTNFGACSGCPANSHSPKARYDLAVCTCNAGYQTSYLYDGTLMCSNTPTSCPTGQYLSGTSCVACDAGKYKNTLGTEVCISCPAASTTTVTGTISGTSCLCNSGYTGENGGTCTACAAGKYKSVTGSAACSDCGVNTYSTVTGANSVSTCQSCPSFTQSIAGSTALTSCVCTPGYYEGPPPNLAIGKSVSVNMGHSNSQKHRNKAIDQCLTADLGCYYEAAGASTGAYLGINLGASTFVSRIRYYFMISSALSDTYTFRVGNNADYSSNAECSITYIDQTVEPNYRDITCSSTGQYVSIHNGKSSQMVVVELQIFSNTGGACTQCPAGQYKAVSGNVACTDCSANTYSTVTGANSVSTCQSCPSNTESGDGSTALTSCVCKLGYTGPNGGTCTACQPGKYKSVTGSSNCLNCSANTYSTATGAIASATCQNCPSFTQSNAGSSALTSCVCNPGYTGPDGGTCSACAAGKYKAVTGSIACTDCSSNSYSTAIAATTVGTCLSCPLNSQSVAGSSTLTSCVCNLGYTGSDGAACTACAAGKYKTVTGSVACTDCRADTFSAATGAISDATCENCRPNSKTQVGVLGTQFDKCECLPGYVYDGASCSLCPTGKYQESWSNVYSCSQCKPNYVTNSPPTNCLCKAGHYQQFPHLGVYSDCMACPAAKFKDTDSNTPCQLCPAGKYNQDTGKSICTSCPAGSWCGQGYMWYDTCPGDTFSLGGAAVCTSCPENSEIVGNKLSSASCQCKNGYIETARNTSTGPTCVACAAGKYKSSSNGCSDCQSNTYSTVVGAGSSATCLACPPNSASLAGSIESTACSCNAGYTGPNGDTCTACVAGKYKSVTGNVLCSDCQLNSISAAGNTALINCLCNAGYTGANGDTCTACLAGKYKSVTGNALCSDCLANSVSTSGGTALTSCQCNPGYTGLNGGTCSVCAAGKYKSVTGDASCSDCPANSVSAVGSTAVTSCQCKPGYTGADGGPCTACQADFYKESIGPAACTQCNLAAQGPVASNSSANCICRAGYYGSNQNNCQTCAVNTYSATPGSLTCSQCPPNTEASGLNDQKEDCKCSKGYTGPDGGTCTACNDTQYKDTVGSSPCSTCKANSVSGCKHSASCCACKLGYKGEVGQECTICPINTYSDINGASACTPCPANTSSPAGTNSVYSCVCLPGHVGSLGYACEACVAGTYKQNYLSCAQCPSNTYSTEVAAVSVATCQACPRNSTSVAGSGSIERCFCVAGYRQTAAHDACIACDPGYYYEATKRYECSQCAGGRYSASVAASGIEVCQDCSAGKWSPPGSPSCQLCPALSDSISRSSFITDCKCNAGATGADGATCISCEAGTYKEAIGSGACEGCPQFSQSLPGSDDETDCKCNAGFTGDDGGPCSGCAESTYKSSVGSLSCTNCPSNAISPPESTKVTDCECDAGFAGADGGSCTSCPENTYKDELDPTTCDDCPLNSQSPSGSALVTDCKCNAGYTGANGAPCQACLAGTFKKSVGPEECLECPADSSSLAGSSVCTCNPGYSGPDDAECTACTAGEYKQASGSAACSRCPENSDSAPASTAQSSCLCNKGYSGPSEGPCAACEPGKYKPGAGSAECESCPEHATPSSDSAAASCECMSGYRLADGVCGACAVGTFKEQAGNASLAGEGCFQQDNCCQCPPNRTTLSTGTVQSGECLCLAGFGGAACQACATGSYKTDVSMLECASCPLGATTLQTRSSAVSDCVAAKGHYGNVTAGFAPCPGGTYAPTQGMQRCLECPPGATSPAGAESEAQCVCELPGWRRAEWGEAGECSCLPGYARNAQTGLCQQCPADHYCQGGDLPAQRCPAASLSAAGSAERTDCVCAAGHSGEDGEACAACAEGTWKAANGSAACTQCAQYTLSPTASTDPEACLCLAGYTGKDGGPCAACETGEYKPELGASACTACSANTTTHGPARTDASECVCVAGFGNETGGCLKCPLGRFKAAVGNGSCNDACPPFSSSPEGSISLASCQCVAGYSGDASTSSCEACPAGSYKEIAGSAACTECTYGATTRETGSTSVAACVCVLGYALMEAGVCSPCPANSFGLGQPGTWAALRGSAGCAPCLQNSFSEEGSDEGLDCLCNPGFEFAGINLPNKETICSACPLGKYTEAPVQPGHQQTCKICPQNSMTTTVAAKNIDACVCVPGHHLVQTSLDASSCQPCPVDSFKDTAGNGACNQCPVNAVAPAGSVFPGACQCLPGFSRGSQSEPGQALPCESCAEGKYKTDLGDQECSECPEKSSSPPASTALTACVCTPGLSGPPGGPCSPCQADTYLFNSMCILCPQDTESESGSTDVFGCKCRPGFSGPPGGPCVPCGVGLYRGRTDLECLQCPEQTQTTTSIAQSVAECMPVPGSILVSVKAPSVELNVVLPYPPEYFTVDVQQAFKRGVASAASTSCKCTVTEENVFITEIVLVKAPTDSRRLLSNSSEISDSSELKSFTEIPSLGEAVQVSVQSQDLIRSALEEQGIEGLTDMTSSSVQTTDIESIFKCPPNTYKDFVGNVECLPCPEHSRSPTGSTSRNNCTCDSAYNKNAGDGSCDRICAPGFESRGGHFCHGCLPSHYKPSRGDEDCTRCPPFSLSFAYNQTSVTSCMCEQGHIWNAATSSCDACPPGSFNNRVNDTDCWDCNTICPPGTNY